MRIRGAGTYHPTPNPRRKRDLLDPLSHIFRLPRGRSSGRWRPLGAGAGGRHGRLRDRLPERGAPRGRNHGHLRRSAGRGDRGAAHEPLLSRPVRAPRVRQERLFRAGDRRRGSRALPEASRSIRVERERARRHGACDVHALRRPGGRHLLRRGSQPCTPEHARDLHVRAGPSPPPDPCGVPRAARFRVACRDPARPDRRPVHVHGAGPRLLHGQSHRGGGPEVAPTTTSARTRSSLATGRGPTATAWSIATRPR
jgi:hypothetical protein